MQAFSKGNAEEVEKWCAKAILEDPYYVEPYILLGQEYERQHRLDDERKLYGRLIAQVPERYEGYLNLGQIERRAGEYDSALAHYEMVIKLKNVPVNYGRAALKNIKELKDIIYLMKHPVPFEPVNVGPPVNTKNDEYPPMFTVDGEDMYFTRRYIDPNSENGVNEDLMVTHKKDGKWQEPQGVENVNTKDNEGATAIAPDGSYMVITECNRADSYGGCDLYISFFKDGEWTKPVNMGEPVNTRFKETQPCISYDGRSIYFASNRPGTLGGLDIWVTTRGINNWDFSEPVNLGPVINTNKDEQTPYIHPDNQTFYFISNGHTNLGESDIFYSRRNEKGDWDSAVNIGYPINTQDEEFGLTVDRLGEYAYFSSNRPGGYGGMDIYYFKLYEKARPHPVTYLKGKVLDAFSNEPVSAYVEIADLKTGQLLIRRKSKKDGSFLVALPTGKDYLVNVSGNGYLFYSDNIPLANYTDPQPYVHDIPLQPIKAGGKVTLKNIFFQTDAHELKPESDMELDKLVNFLKTNPAVKIEISGHTDNTGTHDHNMKLSEARAKAVYEYLVKTGGIAAERLSYKGFGETQPVADNKTEAGKAQNRRTEVKILN